jgi:hypothetical protein
MIADCGVVIGDTSNPKSMYARIYDPAQPNGYREFRPENFSYFTHDKVELVFNYSFQYPSAKDINELNAGKPGYLLEFYAADYQGNSRVLFMKLDVQSVAWTHQVLQTKQSFQMQK